MKEICSRCQCCELEWIECWKCGGQGGEDGEELIQEDPLWYSLDDFRVCDECGGTGGHYECIGNCEAKGRHKISLHGTT